MEQGAAAPATGEDQDSRQRPSLRHKHKQAPEGRDRAHLFTWSSHPLSEGNHHPGDGPGTYSFPITVLNLSPSSSSSSKSSLLDWAHSTQMLFSGWDPSMGSSEDTKIYPSQDTLCFGDGMHHQELPGTNNGSPIPLASGCFRHQHMRHLCSVKRGKSAQASGTFSLTLKKHEKRYSSKYSHIWPSPLDMLQPSWFRWMPEDKSKIPGKAERMNLESLMMWFSH